jgi:hypothetical protein
LLFLKLDFNIDVEIGTISRSHMIVPQPATELAAESVPGRISQVSKFLAMAAVLGATCRLTNAGADALTAFAFAGAFVVHALTRPSRRELGATLASALGIFAIYSLLHGEFIHYDGAWIGWPGAFLGLGSLMVLAARLIRSSAEDRWSNWLIFFNASMLVWTRVFSVISVDLAARATPITWDRVLYAFDLKLAPVEGPSWIAGQWTTELPGLRALCAQIYNALGIALAAGIALQWRERQTRRPGAADLRWVLIATGGVGFLLYQICPAAGPAYLFPNEFPRTIPFLNSIAPAPLAPVARNGMPSLHIGFTLALLWSLRSQPRWIRAAGGVFMALTILATLGLGEHYLIDLIVAPAMVLAVQAFFQVAPLIERIASMAAGAVIVLAWLIAFRTGAAMAIPAGLPTWTLAAITVAIPLMMESRLRAVAEAPAPELVPIESEA